MHKLNQVNRNERSKPVFLIFDKLLFKKLLLINPFVQNFVVSWTITSVLTRGGALNGVFGDILPTFFLIGALTNFNKISHGNN